MPVGFALNYLLRPVLRRSSLSTPSENEFDDHQGKKSKSQLALRFDVKLIKLCNEYQEKFSELMIHERSPDSLSKGNWEQLQQQQSEE